MTAVTEQPGPEPGGGILTSSGQLATAIARLAAEDAVALPLIDDALCARLSEAAGGLVYRQARPLVGAGVRQDFEVCMSFAAASPFRNFAAIFENLTRAALAELTPNPYPGAFSYNDLIVQRYPAGGAGISPHRDHIRYEGLVSIITLSGAGRFFVCADRAGRQAREIASPEGGLILMRAPGFAGRRDRPFHFLRDITRPRVSFGLRYDISLAELPAPAP